jgi:K+-sensing histidine kinase KdpD
MSDVLTAEPASPATPAPTSETTSAAHVPAVARYGASAFFVAVATGGALILEGPIGDRGLTLVYVLPVIAAAALYGWAPSLLATVLGVMAFDFFFTEPKYSLAIAGSADIWAAGLLLVIAAAVSAVAAESRRRELAAREAASQWRALQALAHEVISSKAWPQIAGAAALALNQIFRAPSVILTRRSGELQLAASAGAASLAVAEMEAARWVLSERLALRAEAYPFDASTFDFWPVGGPGERGCVIGVAFQAGGGRRAAEADRFAEMVSAYLAAAMGRAGDTGRP